MANDPQSRRSKRPHRRHTRRPAGFGLWLLAALACTPAVGTAIYNVDSLGWIMTAIFAVGILLHYRRLAVQRKPLAGTLVSGGCLLPVLAWIAAVIALPVIGPRTMGDFLGLMFPMSIFLVCIGAVAGFLTAVLIEAVRSAYVGWRYGGSGGDDALKKMLLRLGGRTTTSCRWRCHPRTSCRGASASAGCWSS